MAYRPVTVFEAPVSDETRAAIVDGWRRYREATEAAGPGAHLERQAQDDADRALIDAVILAFVRQGRRFSSNDIRPHVEGVRKCLISRRLINARREGLIERVSFTPSTLASTKCAVVMTYRPVPEAVAEQRRTPAAPRVLEGALF